MAIGDTENWDKMCCDNCRRVFLTQDRSYVKYCPYCLAPKVDRDCEVRFITAEDASELDDLDSEIQDALSDLSNLESKFEDLAEKVRKLKGKSNDKSRPETT